MAFLTVSIARPRKSVLLILEVFFRLLVAAEGGQRWVVWRGERLDLPLRELWRRLE